jgi:hypothetical protein
MKPQLRKFWSLEKPLRRRSTNGPIAIVPHSIKNISKRQRPGREKNPRLSISGLCLLALPTPTLNIYWIPIGSDSVESGKPPAPPLPSPCHPLHSIHSIHTEPTRPYLTYPCFATFTNLLPEALDIHPTRQFRVPSKPRMGGNRNLATKYLSVLYQQTLMDSSSKCAHLGNNLRHHHQHPGCCMLKMDITGPKRAYRVL